MADFGSEEEYGEEEQYEILDEESLSAGGEPPVETSSSQVEDSEKGEEGEEEQN